MARDKKLMVRSALSDLKSAVRVLESAEANQLTHHEFKTAASQAAQASATLYQLTGMIDAETDFPKRST